MSSWGNLLSFELAWLAAATEWRAMAGHTLGRGPAMALLTGLPTRWSQVAADAGCGHGGVR